MKDVRQDFTRRAREISAFIRLLEQIEHLTATRRGGGLSPDIPAAFTGPTVERTLKGACYLLLYNIVESTARGAVEAIHSHMHDHGALFDDMRGDVKAQILKLLRKKNPRDLVRRLGSIAADVAIVAFDAGGLPCVPITGGTRPPWKRLSKGRRMDRDHAQTSEHQRGHPAA
ncbi:MAG: MAE_28990/MAE_18760 family HEPN-like nuclease [Nannocystaceae bacterium]